MNNIICIDYETATDEGASTETWKSDFRALSCAFTWLTPHGFESKFCVGEDAIRDFLLANLDAQYIAHNIQFEQAVTLSRFPGISLNWLACTQRLLQMADGGGLQMLEQTDFESKEKHMLFTQFQHAASEAINLRRFPAKSCGLGLEAGIKRWLPKKYHNHKQKFHDYLREQCGVKKSYEGQNLHLLPDYMLREYNIADTENTYLLYLELLKHFELINLDWRQDHKLYLSSVSLIVRAKKRGTKINRNKLTKYIESQNKKLGQINSDFREMFLREICELEVKWAKAWINGLKTERGRETRAEKVRQNPDMFRFSINSTKNKTELFVDVLGIKPKYLTPKGLPSFKKPFLTQWGTGGLLLREKGTISIAIKQAENLLELSSVDGRYHPDLKACGTTTGRYAGGDNG